MYCFFSDDNAFFLSFLVGQISMMGLEPLYKLVYILWRLFDSYVLLCLVFWTVKWIFYQNIRKTHCESMHSLLSIFPVFCIYKLINKSSYVLLTISNTYAYVILLTEQYHVFKLYKLGRFNKENLQLHCCDD